jgi:hypothetical protein
MTHHTDPAATVVEQEKLIQGVAKHLLHKLYGPQGMPWGTTFSELEELAVQIGQALSRSMMDQALADQAQHLPPEAETCGVCGATVRAGPSPQHRAMTTTVGQVQWEEPQRDCPQCRAAFFPSEPWVGD